MEFSLIKLLWAISSSKKRHIFLANLKKILKHSLSMREIFFVQKFAGEILKTNQSEFLLKINQNGRHVYY